MYVVSEYLTASENGYQAWYFDSEKKARDKYAERLAIRDGRWTVSLRKDVKQQA